MRQGPMVIGRKNSCELRIPLSSVSRQHCEVTFDGDTVRLRDLGSSNGTYHNSIRVQEAELAAGDEVVVGPVVFTLVIDGVPSDIKPVRTIVGSSDSHSSGATLTSDAGPVALTDDEVVASMSDGGPSDEPIEASTMDMDADPFEQLEAMASQEKGASTGEGSSGAGNLGGVNSGGTTPADSSVIEFDFDDLDKD
ncbi:MAG: FHA domain-containing protein [Planctomycetota bacterium]